MVSLTMYCVQLAVSYLVGMLVFQIPILKHHLPLMGWYNRIIIPMALGTVIVLMLSLMVLGMVVVFSWV